jgi:hypothetical protein
LIVQNIQSAKQVSIGVFIHIIAKIYFNKR